MSDLVVDPVPEGADRLAEFGGRVLSENPFLDNRVNGPGPETVDVEAVHQAAFARLTGLAGEALRGRRGVGAVLWGEAGIGKSHLLARLSRWAEQDNRACFVYLHNLQAAPDHLPRSLLHSVVSVLTLGRSRSFAHTPLFDLVYASLLEAVDHNLRNYSWSQLSAAWTAFLDRLGLAGDRRPYEVLFPFFRSAYRAGQGRELGEVAESAVRWLSGQALDPDEARRLALPPGLRADEPVALEDNQAIKQVLVALTRLAAGKGRPFLLVFDQVDNLDTDQAAALARFLQALIDSSSNLLVVTAGVQSTLLGWREARVFQDSAWDRLAQIEVRLGRLTADEARRIVQARLDRFLDPFADLEPLQQKRQADPLFPLGRSWKESTLEERVDVRPRDALNWAREGWRREQEALDRLGVGDWLANWPRSDGEINGQDRGPTSEEVQAAIDRKVEDRLAEVLAELQQHPETLPPDGDQLAGLVYALLVQCRNSGHRYGVVGVERLPPPRRDVRPTYDLTVRQRGTDGGELCMGVLVLTVASAVSATGFLRRLRDDTRPFDRLVVVTDQRIGLPLGDRGREYLHDLEQTGADRFRRVDLSFDEYARLEALQRVVGLARSGDLEVEVRPGQGRVIEERDVIDSYHRHGRYLAAPLLHTLLVPEENPPPVAPSEAAAQTPEPATP
jgi:hypothetical protein